MPQLVFFIGIVFILLFFFCMINYKNRTASYFSLTCLSIAIFNIGYGLELISQTPGKLEFAIMVQIFGLIFISPIWALASYEFYYNRNSAFLTKFMIFIIPMITLVISATNDYHHLYYTNYFISEYNSYTMAQIIKGPWYYLFIVYTYSVFIYGIGLFFKLWRKSSFGIKTPEFLIVLGSLFPGIAYCLYALGVLPIPYDFTTLGFALFALAFSVALFKFDFLKLKEVAREFVFDEVNEGIIVVDNNNRIIDFNRSAQKMFAWLIPNHLGMSLLEFEEGRLIGVNTKEKFKVNIKCCNKTRHVGFTVTPVLSNQKYVGKILIFQDITEQVVAMEELKKIATHDTLSGVYNRRKLMNEGEKEFYRAQRYQTHLSALMLDIDYFKKINDTYGHLAGDMVIKCLASQCQLNIRQSDIIGRYGGEEFLILAPNTDINQTFKLAEDLRKIVEDMEIEYNDQRIKVKVSIGVASTQGSLKKRSLTELINESDKALYEAKNSGRNRVCTFNQPKLSTKEKGS
ncbi:histidine kinase N-terminal 7TM domain-containing diguanylate cyclase [Bacillus marasmi]|uniref:histidine kinase N-terminal 7TM domain-containing diguanylate cyclase n=1 Tax=Bacillus marasmi TaxID=1926279 RepID=UPI0011C7520B|nr:diguanylate cyclase [Bacillus marasmi]